MMHLSKSRNLSISFNYRAPASFAVKDEGQLLFLFCNHIFLQDFVFHYTFSKKFHNFSYRFQNILYSRIESKYFMCCWDCHRKAFSKYFLVFVIAIFNGSISSACLVQNFTNSQMQTMCITELMVKLVNFSQLFHH